jgi:uracil-DNA glycosylase family 4
MTDSSLSCRPSTQTHEQFDLLISQAQQCRICQAMDGRARVLSRANGPPSSGVLLVGEAPGRLGADRSGIPFSGDESGRRLDLLLTAAGWDRGDVFITNAVLCNPRDDRGRNREPSRGEQTNCLVWLTWQIEMVDPTLVIALGAVALSSLADIERHTLRVRDAGSSPICWYNRHLAAVYHPGRRAGIHRTFEQQIDDFQRLGLWLDSLSVESAERQ